MFQHLHLFDCPFQYLIQFFGIFKKKKKKKDSLSILYIVLQM